MPTLIENHNSLKGDVPPKNIVRSSLQEFPLIKYSNRKETVVYLLYAKKH